MVPKVGMYSGSRKRQCARGQRQENTDRVKKQSDCRIPYCALRKKKIIVISTAVFFLSFLFQEHTKFKQVYQKAVYCRALNKSLPLYHNAKRIGYISFTIYICVIFLSFEKTSFSDHFKCFNTLTSFNSDKILNSFPILLLFKG